MPRILSVQSHVAYGYVGGKAAVFPLQLLGYDVDVVNSVNYSNHSAYRRIGGTKTTADDLNRLFATMAQNELLSPDRLLTGTRLPIYLDLDSSSVGYIPGAGPLNAVADLARKLRAQNPNLVYLLDPVMGDAGLLYVASDVIPVYRSMLSFATIITPNWFEVEYVLSILPICLNFNMLQDSHAGLPCRFPFAEARPRNSPYRLSGPQRCD